MQIDLRSFLIKRTREKYMQIWPIDQRAATKPPHWSGWPDKKKFALILTHDVESSSGRDKCLQLADLEEKHGFRSSFNFVPERYENPPELREELISRGFEVGVHGLLHDGRLYESEKTFNSRAKKINSYIKDWQAVGFRSPAMHHNLEWIHRLDISYDASTFDTDPFEPQPDGVKTIFPFWVNSSDSQNGYVELPYTLAQDFTVFVLMKEKTIDIWTTKIDWIVEQGGMVLVNVHPDYMNFNDQISKVDEFPASYYESFLVYIKEKYTNQYLHLLPRKLAEFWKNKYKI